MQNWPYFGEYLKAFQSLKDMSCVQCNWEIMRVYTVYIGNKEK